MKLTPDFEKFCSDRKIIPELLITQFMADATGSAGNGGSNERDAAAAYVFAVEHLVTDDQVAFWERFHGRDGGENS